MNDNVISMRSKRPLAETLAEEAETAEEKRKEEIRLTLEWFDKIRANIESGKFVMPMVLAWAPDAGLFFSDFMTPVDGIPHGLANSYIAQLELLKIAMTDIALEGPILNVDLEAVPLVEYEEVDV